MIVLPVTAIATSQNIVLFSTFIFYFYLPLEKIWQKSPILAVIGLYLYQFVL